METAKFMIVLLDASSHLHKRVCPSVGPSVCNPFFFRVTLGNWTTLRMQLLVNSWTTLRTQLLVSSWPCFSLPFAFEGPEGRESAGTDGRPTSSVTPVGIWIKLRSSSSYEEVGSGGMEVITNKNFQGDIVKPLA